jgi:release factor glutamine methyltransferase
MNIGTAISHAAAALEDAGIAEPRREASSMLSYVIGQDAAFLIAHSDDSLAAPYKMMFEACVRRRAKHEPFQYITGRQEFYRLEFEVTPDVLIPRPETEILVEKAIEILKGIDTPRFCEIGVGSGCISIAILHAVPHANAVGVDVSPAALTVAGKNAEKNGAARRLTLIEGDVLTGVDGRFDMIVSNPPYVPADQLGKLQAEVRDFEPQAALAGGDDGLDIIERIVADAPKFLRPNGYLLLEVGFDQAERVTKLFNSAVWHSPETLPDLQQIPRVVVARLR